MDNQYQLPQQKKQYIFNHMVKRSITLEDLAVAIFKVAEDISRLRIEMNEVNEKVSILNHRVARTQRWIKSKSNRNGFWSAPKIQNASFIKEKSSRVAKHAEIKPKKSTAEQILEKGPPTLKGIQFFSSLSIQQKSHVWSGLNEHHEIVCIKTYFKINFITPQIMRIEKEKETLKSLEHPNIPKFYILKKKPATINLVMEYGGSMTLTKLIKSLNQTQTMQEKEACKIFVQILSVFEYLEAKGLAHCNLNSDKIVLRNKQQVKVVSFRYSVSCNMQANIRYFQKIYRFTAPEVQSKFPYNPHLSDQWMLGIILLKMLISRRSFKDFISGRMIENARNLKSFFSKKVSQPAQQLVEGFLKIDPSQRLSPKDALQSQWIKNVLFLF